MTQELGISFGIAALVLAACLGPLAIAAVWLAHRKRKRRAARRSPISGELLRQAGTYLRDAIDAAHDDAMTLATTLVVAPSLMMAFLFVDVFVHRRLPSSVVMGFVAAFVLAYGGWAIPRMQRQAKQIDNWRLDLDAEIAAGQELDQLMRQGAYVFHDFPAEKFNIDHVVIAREGVFAVETKGYSKPNRNGGTSDATVIFDGKRLSGPDWSSTKAIEQAARNARWLTDWLHSATGDKTTAVPVLTMPGWFVERKGRGDVFVLSGRELQGHLLKVRRGDPLTPEQIQRAVHQVEQRCRSMPLHYRPMEEEA